MIEYGSASFCLCRIHLKIAFVTLLVIDFLNEIPSQEEIRIALLDCCTSFGSSKNDVNTSLTAIGMIWTIADRDSSPSAVDVSYRRA